VRLDRLPGGGGATTLTHPTDPHHHDGSRHAAAGVAPFAHDALFYEGIDGFLDAVLPFVREGLEAGEPTMVAVAGDRLTALRSALDGDGDGLLLVDMAGMGRNPARIIGRWHDFVAARGGGGPLRGVGEPIWAGRSPEELVECQHHESLINLAFADVCDFRLICPYDVAALPEDVIDAARRSHPALVEGGARGASAEYAPPPPRLPVDADLPAPPESAVPLAFGREDVSGVRRLVAARATEAGLSAARADDLMLAVSELATNSVRYGGGGGTLAMWADREAFVCEVRDAGRLDDPLVGRARPAAGQRSGRGMWLVNEVCDLVQVRSTDRGTVVRLHLRLR
jgi:anti-sigma regulatory factor (Ser/Thr protein kinase)